MPPSWLQISIVRILPGPALLVPSVFRLENTLFDYYTIKRNYMEGQKIDYSKVPSGSGVFAPIPEPPVLLCKSENSSNRTVIVLCLDFFPILKLLPDCCNCLIVFSKSSCCVSDSGTFLHIKSSFSRVDAVRKSCHSLVNVL